MRQSPAIGLLFAAACLALPAQAATPKLSGSYAVVSEQYCQPVLKSGKVVGGGDIEHFIGTMTVTGTQMKMSVKDEFAQMVGSSSATFKAFTFTKSLVIAGSKNPFTTFGGNGRINLDEIDGSNVAHRATLLILGSNDEAPNNCQTLIRLNKN